MAKQKKLEDLNHEINIETILKVLWAIKDKDQFYFVTYGKELFDNLIKQKPYRKKDLIDFYEFIKKECDIVNTSGYAETHVNWFLEKRLSKDKRSN